MELSDQAPSYSPSAGKTCASVAIAADRANSGRNVGTARKARRRKKSTTTPSTSSSPSSPKPWRAALAVLSFGAIVPNRQISPSVELGSSSSAARGRCRRRPAVAVQALSITTFNVLAAVHRSVPAPPGQPQVERRESERKDWWQPRAEGLAKFVADELAFSDAVLLQEWWFGTEFEEIFDYHTGGIFDRVAEQRPGPGGTLREDGMAVLVKRKGKLELMGSDKVRTGPQRIAQIVKCRERGRGDRGGRPVLLGNTHLSFPGDPDRITNERRQAFEVQLVARAISRAGRRLSSDGDCEGHMQIIGGDFNSDVCSLASAKLESRHDFVNCMSAYSEQNLCSIGGRVNIGVTPPDAPRGGPQRRPDILQAHDRERRRVEDVAAPPRRPDGDVCGGLPEETHADRGRGNSLGSHAGHSDAELAEWRTEPGGRVHVYQKRIL
eukprot:CAMPEP_0172536312 /NCGR_PEP_ID=MMETSP1067-20121228/8098_1 /TAXON_ID=265564 ORGANISM="Thalassiosira punctigera, Strain Tpunct2005C2" /NCGR_SAMPLE_ID=MMETSP1067 /ASSEMBLY_ACC=CAM_ASM_000444 /LENGTH=437 /DNA_ID=CAMNT_0013321359 /DNA_START=10 /DNA_END=1322 /DNA_ORIENTATION=+